MTAQLMIRHLDVVFFFYGLCFFILGIVIFLQIRITRQSQYTLLSVLPLLGGFGIIHGFNEWLDMFAIIKKGAVFSFMGSHHKSVKKAA